MTFKQFLQRLVWTPIVNVLAGITAANVLSYDTWKGAVTGALAAALDLIVRYGRAQLTRLPEPEDPAVPPAHG